MKRSGSDWWQLAHDDFWTSETVLAMSDGAKAVYLFLLGMQAKNGSLPAEPRLVRGLLSALSERSWRDFAPFLDTAFPVDRADGKRRNLNQAKRLERIDGDRERERVRKSDARRGGHAPDIVRTSGGRPDDVPLERRGEREEKDSPGVRERASPAPAQPESPPRVSEVPVVGRVAVHVAVDSPLGVLAMHWRAEWSRLRDGADYALAEDDIGSLSRALRLAGGDAGEACKRATALIDSADPFERKKASPEWLSRSDVWNRLGAESASGKPAARRAAEPADAREVHESWCLLHRTVSTIERSGRPYEVVGTDVPFPGYDAAKAELAARASSRGRAAAGGAS